jgi:hypothetical protein
VGSQDRDDLVFEPGTRIEVFNRFDGGWSRAFEVAGRHDEGYQVRRMSDGHVLPEVFPPEGVRAER